MAGSTGPWVDCMLLPPPPGIGPMLEPLWPGPWDEPPMGEDDPPPSGDAIVPLGGAIAPPGGAIAPPGADMPPPCDPPPPDPLSMVIWPRRPLTVRPI